MEEHVIHPEARTQPRLQSKVATWVQMLNMGRATFFRSSTKAYSIKTVNDFFLVLSGPGAGFLALAYSTQSRLQLLFIFFSHRRYTTYLIPRHFSRTHKEAS